MGLCEHIVVLEYGHKIADGLPQEVQRDGKSAIARISARERNMLKNRPHRHLYGRVQALKQCSLTSPPGEFDHPAGRQRRE